MTYDLVLKNARLVDPANGLDRLSDLAIAGGKVARVAPEIGPTTAKRTWDLTGKVIAPALIDAHMHTTLGPGGEAAFAMLARAGVATAVDFAGPPAQVLALMAGHGSGITVASLQVVRPAPDGNEHAFSSGPDTVIPTDDPDAPAIRHAVLRGLHTGAIGTKILGGHFPFTPEATERIIDESVALGVYMAVHVGTTATGSNLAGLEEAIKMATPIRRLHLCHINSALRGQILPSRLEEAARAMALLEQAGEAVISESFLTRWSPDPGLCLNGIPDSAIVRTSLRMGGYEPTEAGLERAIVEGFTVVIVPRRDENVAVGGAAGVRYWRETGTTAGIAFPISFADVGLVCATQKRRDGRFTVSAIASDSGQLPFNVTLDHGLTLVQFGALTLSELIHKASYAPSRMLGLVEKGQLGEGADADIVVIDVERRRADHLLVAGDPVMTNGLVVGRGGAFLTTEAGVPAVAAHGLPYRLLDLSRSLLYRGNPA
ncbi:MAG: amidohydrolase family protein [Thermomicrobiales bacterium]